MNPRQFVWSVLATDADFGPDGALYFSDWVEGWDKPNKGRLYRALDPSRRGDPLIQQVKTLLAEGMEPRSIDELAKLLAHPDMRVRQEAQFELAGRGDNGRAALTQVARSAQNQLARIHAIWGLGQVARTNRDGRRQSQWSTLEPLLADADPEIRVQAAKVLGEAKESNAFAGLIRLLSDASPRVRLLAAIAVGKLGRSEAIGPLLAMLRANGDQDPYLRHAGVMGLAGSGNIADWRRASHDSSAAVRMGVLLALRRVGAPEIAEFVNDPDPRLVLEAARAINDVPITAAMPALATLPVTANTPLPLARRILNANFRLGGAGNAAAMAEAASRSDVSSSARTMALRLLADWAKPSGRDAIMGLWRPISPRPSQAAADALRPKLAAILASSSEYVRDAAVPAIAALGIKDASPRLAELATDRRQSDNTRSLALKALDQLADPRRIDAAQRLDFAWIPKPYRGAPRTGQGRSCRGDGTDSRSARTWLASRAARGDRRFGRHAWRPGQADPLRLARPVDRRPGSP